MRGSERLTRLIVILFVALAAAGTALCAEPLPALRSRVTDTAGVLPPERVAALEASLADFEKTKGSQIAVLIVSTTAPETIEQYAMRAAEAWKLGRKGVDDGALFAIAIKDRRMRIEVGYGLEGALNDATCKRIIDEIVKPHFQQGDIPGGVEAGVEQMIKVVSGEPLPAPGKSKSLELGPSGNLLIFAVFAAIFLGAALQSVLGRPLSATLSGALIFIAGTIMLTAVIAAILAVVVFIIVMFGKTGGAGGFTSRSSGGWGGSFGGGGFSGGGGSFGGGGASGGW